MSETPTMTPRRRKPKLSNVIKRHRMTIGMSLNDAAARLAVSATTLSRWEKGEVTPATTNIPRLARFLGMEPGELVDIIMGDGTV